MVVNILAESLDLTVQQDEDHLASLSKLRIKNFQGVYKAHQDEMMSFKMAIHELLIYDERKVTSTISTCYVQRQSSEIISKDIPVFELDYQAQGSKKTQNFSLFDFIYSDKF